MASRVAGSLLHASGLGEQLVCKTLHEYEELAIALAEDSDRLYTIRQHLEQTRNNNAAFDTVRWVRNFENGINKIWKRHEQNFPPEHIEVEDKDPLFVIDDSIM